ncbi:MAG: hypothetical protein HYU78_14300 [Rhodocyclales bacterium]|nr:hypothetical protein [Rhodocyclales bacterium]
MRSHLSIIFRLLLLLLLVRQSVFPAWADGPEELAAPRFSLRAFGTLGMARSSSDHADFVRDLSQPEGTRGQWTGKVDSLLGVQANYHFSEQLEGVAQAVSRYRYDKSFRPEVGWAFLKYDPGPRLSLRAGRVGTEFYMQADSRQIGYSYLPVRPPTDYFTTLPIYYMDGGDAVLTVPAAQGLAKFKAFYGVAGEKIPLADRAWDFTGSRIFGGYADYLQGAWQWRLSYAQLRYSHEIPFSEMREGLRLTGVPSAVAAADALSIVGQRAHFYSAGVVYDRGPVQAQLMLSRTMQESALFEDSSAGYGLLAYRFPSLTPYLGFSRARSSARHLATGLPDAVSQLAALNAGVAALMRQSHIDQHTFFVGVRWDVQSNVALKVQWDRVRGAPGSVAFQQAESPAWNGRTNVLSLTLDFVF